MRRAVESAERRFAETARRGVQQLEVALEDDARNIEGVLVRFLEAMAAASVALSTAGAAIATNGTNESPRAKGNS